MRLVLAMVLAGLVALPLSASAQAGEEDALSSWQAPPEEPPMQLQLDDAGVEALEEMNVRVRRAGIGLGVSLAAFVGGLAMVAFAAGESNFVCVFECPPPANWVAPVGATGGFLLAGGLVGTIFSGVRLGRNKRELRRLQAPTQPKLGREAPEPHEDRYDPLGIEY